MINKKSTYHLHSKSKLIILKFQFNRLSRLNFYKTLAMLLRSGFDIGEALNKRRSAMMKYSSKYFNKNQYLIEITDDILFRYKDLGFTFADAIRPYIPSDEFLLLDSSNSSKVEDSLVSMIDVSTKLKLLGSAVKKSLFKPVMLLLSIVGLMFFSAKKVMPTITGSIPVDQIPEFTKSFSSFNEWVLNYGIFVIVLTIVMSILISYSLPNYTGKARKSLLDYLPPYNVFKSISSVKMMISISLILKDKTTSITEAFRKISLASNPYLKTYISYTQKKISQGVKPGIALATSGLFDREISILIDIYSESGKLKEGLKDLTYEYLDVQIKKIESGFAVINAFFMLLTGVYISCFMWAIYAIGMGGAM